MSSVTGTTQEVVQAVQEIKRSAQRYLVLSMQKTVFLADLCDYVVTYPAPGTEQIKFFMVADRLMQKQRIYRLRKLLPRIGRIFAYRFS